MASAPLWVLICRHKNLKVNPRDRQIAVGDRVFDIQGEVPTLPKLVRMLWPDRSQEMTASDYAAIVEHLEDPGEKASKAKAGWFSLVLKHTLAIHPNMLNPRALEEQLLLLDPFRMEDASVTVTPNREWFRELSITVSVSQGEIRALYTLVHLWGSNTYSYVWDVAHGWRLVEEKI